MGVSFRDLDCVVRGCEGLRKGRSGEEEPELMDFGELDVGIGRVLIWWRRRLGRGLEG